MLGSSCASVRHMLRELRWAPLGQTFGVICVREKFVEFSFYEVG